MKLAQLLWSTVKYQSRINNVNNHDNTAHECTGKNFYSDLFTHNKMRRNKVINSMILVHLHMECLMTCLNFFPAKGTYPARPYSYPYPSQYAAWYRSPFSSVNPPRYQTVNGKTYSASYLPAYPAPYYPAYTIRRPEESDVSQETTKFIPSKGVSPTVDTFASLKPSFRNQKFEIDGKCKYQHPLATHVAPSRSLLMADIREFKK